MFRLHTLPIRIKIIALNVIVLFSGFIVGLSAFYYCFSVTTARDVREAGEQLVQAQAKNLDSILEHITLFSNMVYFDEAIQATLKNIDRREIQADDLRTIQNSLNSMILSNRYIDGAVLINSYNGSYKSVRQNNLSIDTARVKSSDWYPLLMESKGDGFFTHRSGGVISFPGHPDQNYITYIRTIPDMGTYEELAILMLIIDADAIRDLLYDEDEETKSVFYISDSQGNYIIPPARPIELPAQAQTQRYLRLEGVPSVSVKKDLGIRDWQLTALIPIHARTSLSITYTISVLVFIAVNTLMTLVVSMILRTQVFNPLLSLQTHMKKIERGDFSLIDTPQNGTNEILTLQRVSNHMISSIQSLIEQVKIEEQIIAKNEFDILAAQLKPHFLYNTLDAASALSLTGDTKNCFTLLQALGQFYRANLNSGRELVSVEQEIKAIRNYITILNIRYENRIHLCTRIPPDIEKYSMLKLLLQPLVENAVYHGIRERDGEGTILISAEKDADFLIFTVRDDGVGMDEAQIQSITGTDGRKAGFGIYSLIQRISLYYGIAHPLSIQSEPGLGTAISIRIGAAK